MKMSLLRTALSIRIALWWGAAQNILVDRAGYSNGLKPRGAQRIICRKRPPVIRRFLGDTQPSSNNAPVFLSKHEISLNGLHSPICLQFCSFSQVSSTFAPTISVQWCSWVHLSKIHIVLRKRLQPQMKCLQSTQQPAKKHERSKATSGSSLGETSDMMRSLCLFCCSLLHSRAFKIFSISRYIPEPTCCRHTTLYTDTAQDRVAVLGRAPQAASRSASAQG